MAKTKKVSRQQQKEPQGFFAKFNLEEILPQKYHVLAVILLIIILFLIFLNPLFFGNKTFQSGDIIAAHSMENYINYHHDGYTLWNPLIFCGMPAYAIGTGFKWFNLIWVGIAALKYIFVSLFSVNYTTWTLYLMLLGINSFFLMKYITKNTLVSLFTAIATSFSTGLIVFLFIGHVTKLVALSMYPLIFLEILRFEKKIKVIDFLLLIIAFQIMLQGFHVQIIFYTFFAIAVYYIYFFLRGLIKKNNVLVKSILKSAVVLSFAALIAGAIQLDNFTQIYQYLPYSTRGGKSIAEKESKVENESSSAYYEYHTNWSFSPEEVMTFIVPSFYGFGNSIYNGSLTNDRDVEVNTYFGQMPFVDVAMYMGVLIFFLALFTIFTRWKEPFVQFLTVLAGVALLVSFGKNFPILFDPLFNFLPYFDKFRVPSMILVLDQVTFPILAGLGLMKIISLRNDRDAKLINAIRNIAIVFGGLFVISLLLNSAISQWFIGRVSDYATGLRSSQPRLSQQFTALSEYMAGMFSGDLMFAMGFSALAFGAGFYYINQKISRDSFVLLIIFLTIIDLWRIDARGERYTTQPDINNVFNTPKYIQVIKAQNDKEPFRILNMKQDGSYGSLNNNSNYNAYFRIEDFYGYSAIKPRSYQDLMDVIGPVNSTLWRMLNVKYIVASKPLPWSGFNEIYKDKNEIIYRNENALPRVYFVNKVEQKPDIQVLNMAKQNLFDPKNIAFVNEEKLNVDVPDSTASSKITEYRDELLGIDVNASGNNFMFFGDTYLPTGWKAYIDGQKTKIYKTDHGFMGIIVPKGKHKVEFKYAPTSFYISQYTALILSSFVLLGLIISILIEIKRKKRINLQTAES